MLLDFLNVDKLIAVVETFHLNEIDIPVELVEILGDVEYFTNVPVRCNVLLENVLAGE